MPQVAFNDGTEVLLSSDTQALSFLSKAGVRREFGALAGRLAWPYFLSVSLCEQQWRVGVRKRVATDGSFGVLPCGVVRPPLLQSWGRFRRRRT